MKFFIDSANLDEIADSYSYGIIDGVTTNPSLMAKNGQNPKEVLKEICQIASSNVSAEVYSEDFENILKEADILYSISEKIVVKLPMTIDGIKACKKLSMQKLRTNVTLCFSPTQALLAAKAGATYVSPFIGRLEDNGEDGMNLIHDIKQIFMNNSELNTQILAASIRNVRHVVDAAKIGVDVATLPFKIIKKLYHHELTEQGLDKFRQDANQSMPII